MSFWSIFFGFTLGFLFLLMGGMTLWAGHWIGWFLIFIALLLLPPVRYLVYRRTGVSITPVMRTFFITVVLALFVIFMRYFVDDLRVQLDSAGPTTEIEPDASSATAD